MQKLIMVNIDDDGRITKVDSRYSIKPLAFGDNTVLEIYDNDTKLSNLLDENMQVVFDFWFKKVVATSDPYYLLIAVPGKGINMILPNLDLAFKEEITNMQKYYPAANGVIFFFTETGALIAYNLYSRSEMYKIQNVKCDDSFQTINYDNINFKYFYYIDSFDNKAKIIDIHTGKCILSDVPIAESIKILYQSENAFLIKFKDIHHSESWLVNSKTFEYLVIDINKESINISYEFEYNGDFYVVITDSSSRLISACSKDFVVKISQSGKPFLLNQEGIYDFLTLSTGTDKMFATYYKQPPYKSLNRTLFDLNSQKEIFDNYYCLFVKSDSIIHIIFNVNVESSESPQRRGAIFDVSKTKLLTDPKDTNITDIFKTNDEDILVVELEYSKYALFSISKEKFISDKFDSICYKFNHKGFIKVKNSKGKENKLDKSGNLVNDEWI